MKRRNIRGLCSCYRKALDNGRSTPILFFISECPSSRPDRRPKRAERLIKLWPGVLQEPLATEAKRALADVQKE